MGRHVAGDAPEMDALVEEAIRAIGTEIDALRVPRLWGVVLGGGYGRGEGGVFVLQDGAMRLSNDLDFYVVAEEGASGAELASIGAALAPVAARWTERLGVDVDFCPAKTPWRLHHDEERLMVQELVHGHFDVAGAGGETLFAGIARREPSALPWMEAARLMMNRGMGLLLAAARGDAPAPGDQGFVARNINKGILGAGDARLIARGRYAWRIHDRADALGDALYRAAAEWKLRPRAEAVCRWEEARTVWLEALEEIGGARDARPCNTPGGDARGGKSPGGRSLFNAARWIARRRTLGNLASLGLDPVERVLRRVRRHIVLRLPISPSLRRDWEVFN